MRRHGHKRLSFGRHRLSDRQIELLLFFYKCHRTRPKLTRGMIYRTHRNRPTMAAVGKALGGIGNKGVRSHLLPLNKRGYIGHDGRRILPWHLTEKALAWCKAWHRDHKRRRKRSRQVAERNRDRWLYYRRMAGYGFAEIEMDLDRIACWPPITRAKMGPTVRAFAEREGLPAPPVIVHAKRRRRK